MTKSTSTRVSLSPDTTNKIEIITRKSTRNKHITNSNNNNNVDTIDAIVLMNSSTTSQLCKYHCRGCGIYAPLIIGSLNLTHRLDKWCIICLITKFKQFNFDTLHAPISFVDDVITLLNNNLYVSYFDTPNLKQCIMMKLLNSACAGGCKGCCDVGHNLSAWFTDIPSWYTTTLFTPISCNSPPPSLQSPIPLTPTNQCIQPTKSNNTTSSHASDTTIPLPEYTPNGRPRHTNIPYKKTGEIPGIKFDYYGDYKTPGAKIIAIDRYKLPDELRGKVRVGDVFMTMNGLPIVSHKDMFKWNMFKNRVFTVVNNYCTWDEREE